MDDLFNNPLFFIELCSGFLVMCVGPALTALLFYFWYSINFKKANVWKEFANKYGFRYVAPNLLLREYGSMSGTFEGRAITIFSKFISRSRTITMVRLKASDTRGFFLSTGEKAFLFGNFYRTTGGHLVAVESGFDERLSTYSNSPELAAKILRTDSRLLTEIKTLLPLELLAKDGVISVSIRGSYADEAQLLRLIRLAFRFAAVLEQNLQGSSLQ